MNAITEIDEQQDVQKRPCTCEICMPSLDLSYGPPVRNDDEDEEAAAPAQEAAAKAFAA